MYPAKMYPAKMYPAVTYQDIHSVLNFTYFQGRMLFWKPYLEVTHENIPKYSLSQP